MMAQNICNLMSPPAPPKKKTLRRERARRKKIIRTYKVQKLILMKENRMTLITFKDKITLMKSMMMD